MRFMHLSDLHLGKKLNEYSLADDQRYILQQLVALAEKQQPDAILLAGDIYDKSIPSVEAVSMFNSFLTALAALKLPVCIISGNHDSAERLDFAADLLHDSGVHIAGCYQPNVAKVVLEDSYGKVNIYLLPFIKPAMVKHYLTEDEAAKISDYHSAVAYVMEHLPLNAEERNVLVAHQFITGAKKCDSEAVFVGGLDNVGAEVFNAFDYVALGHIHSPQNLAEGRIRYCGTPLKYSFSECNQQKSVTFVTLGVKGELAVEEVPLTPLREVRKLKGTYAEVMQKSFYKDFPMDADGRLRDFFQVILTDEYDVLDAAGKLRSVYKNLLQLNYDNKRTQNMQNVEADTAVVQKSPLTLIDEFYELQNNQPLSTEQREVVQALLDEMEGEDA